jgi:hypothetical protein
MDMVCFRPLQVGALKSTSSNSGRSSKRRREGSSAQPCHCVLHITSSSSRAAILLHTPYTRVTFTCRIVDWALRHYCCCYPHAVIRKSYKEMDQCHVSNIPLMTVSVSWP